MCLLDIAVSLFILSPLIPYLSRKTERWFLITRLTSQPYLHTQRTISLSCSYSASQRYLHSLAKHQVPVFSAVVHDPWTTVRGRSIREFLRSSAAQISSAYNLPFRTSAMSPVICCRNTNLLDSSSPYSQSIRMFAPPTLFGVHRHRPTCVYVLIATPIFSVGLRHLTLKAIMLAIYQTIPKHIGVFFFYPQRLLLANILVSCAHSLPLLEKSTVPNFSRESC
ncbi:unnamed protein product [Acanthosepion pharaonis]|uniref:Uncharacterized protein n=1 Tax=Acanthosepion pharaonis TaxID=158019 RepID=A0A812EU47_ACAPH|nr:unnamed protein product [Sepia pharaonis]